MLDLWQQNQGISARPQTGEATDLPVGFDAAFETAWHEGQLYSSSISTGNAQMAALEGYIGDIKNLSGQDISRDVYSRIDLQQAAQDAVAKIRQARPDLQLPDLTDDELNRRAATIAGQARQAYEAGGEKTFGGKVGSFLGSTAASFADPLNLVAGVVAPETELGIVGSAALWGGYGAVTQAANEAINLPMRERVQPDYLESGAPGLNILESGVGGAVLGGVFKTLGNTWTRMKTGEWPRTVRDAGNIVEGEANTQASNVLPGVEGEAAHVQAMSTAIDQILNGHGVDVGTMEASRDLVSRLQGEPAFTLPVINEQTIRLISEEAGLRERQGALRDQLANLPQGDISAADRLNRLETVEQQIAGTTDRDALRQLNERRDQILVDTNHESLRAAAAPIGQRRAMEAEQDAIAARLADIEKERSAIPAPPMLGQRSPVAPSLFDIHTGRIDALMDMREKALQIGANAAEQRAEAAAQQELPLVAGTLDLVHDFHINAMAKGIQQLALFAAHDLPDEEAQALAQRVARSNTDDEARSILNEVPLRPRTLLDTLPSVSDIARASRGEPEELPLTTPEARAETFADPQHIAAMTADLERMRDQGQGGMIPVGVDERGEPKYQLLDAALQDAKNDSEAADQIESCINPPTEEAAE